ARGFATTRKAAGGARVVTREAAVVRAGLAVVQVDLDAENGLGAADRELEVGTEARSRVPLTIVVAGEVAVVNVAAGRRDLVEGAADRHLRRRWRRLRKGRQRRYREDDYCENCDDKTSPHYRLLKWW